jgi:hypothetical protein
MTETQARLLIRIPASLKARLVELARRERRSLNKEIEFLLECGIRDEEKSETNVASRQARTRKQGK